MASTRPVQRHHALSLSLAETDGIPYGSRNCHIMVCQGDEGENVKNRLSEPGKGLRGLLPEMLHWLEILVAALVVVFVAIGTVNLLIGIGGFWGELAHEGVHTVFENVLSEILLLVVGIELAILLVRRTPESLVEVMFFVIARKTLIKTGPFYELLIGVAALAGLFAIRKYLASHRSVKQLRSTDH